MKFSDNYLIPCHFWVMSQAKLSAQKTCYVKIRESPKTTTQAKSPPLCPLGGRQNLDDFRGFSMRRSDPMVTKGGPGRRERAPRRDPPLKVVESAWWVWWWVRGEEQMTRWWQLKYFLCSPLFGEMISNLTNIFQRGWNHQPEENPEHFGWLFSLVKREQMSNWLGVEHQPAIDYRWELLFFSGCKWVAWHFMFLVRLSDEWRGIHIICRWWNCGIIVRSLQHLQIEDMKNIWHLCIFFISGKWICVVKYSYRNKLRFRGKDWEKLSTTGEAQFGGFQSFTLKINNFSHTSLEDRTDICRSVDMYVLIKHICAHRLIHSTSRKQTVLQMVFTSLFPKHRRAVSQPLYLLFCTFDGDGAHK